MTIAAKYPTFKIIKGALTWKPLFRRNLNFLGKLNLSEAINEFLEWRTHFAPPQEKA